MQDESYVSIPLRARDGSIRAYAIVDRDDGHLAQRRWYREPKGYVVRSTPRRADGTQGKTRLHREVLNLPSDSKLEVDHINRNRLDNRRSNLRIATRAQNAQNMPTLAGRASRYRGVTWNRSTAKWTAGVTLRGRHHYLGRFVDEEDAAAAASIFRILFMPFSNETPEP